MLPLRIMKKSTIMVKVASTGPSFKTTVQLGPEFYEGRQWFTHKNCVSTDLRWFKLKTNALISSKCLPRSMRIKEKLFILKDNENYIESIFLSKFSYPKHTINQKSYVSLNSVLLLPDFILIISFCLRLLFLPLPFTPFLVLIGGKYQSIVGSLIS